MKGAAAITQRALRRAKLERAKPAADELGEIALDKHLSSPRTGVGLNKNKLRRSSPKNAPANESGTLALELAKDPTELPSGYRVPVNYGVQERGYAEGHLEPRPLGRISSAELKARRR